MKTSCCSVMRAMSVGLRAAPLFMAMALAQQAHGEGWQKTFGGAGAEQGYTLQQTNAALITLGELIPLYQGIEFRRASVGESQAYVLRIDLNAPGIAFTSTPPAGPLDTIAQTTSEFLESSGTQVAINANFFSPCCASKHEPKDLIGLAISDGTVVSPFMSNESASALLIMADHNATLTTIEETPSGIDDAVTGSDMLVRDGNNIAPVATTGFAGPNPRTAVGLSEDKNILYLVVIDGRQPGYSIGATLQETANLLIALGAFDALNLDGGGSATMVQSDGIGGSLVLNQPSGGSERFNGNNFGVLAFPLSDPESSMPSSRPNSKTASEDGFIIVGAAES